MHGSSVKILVAPAMFREASGEWSLLFWITPTFLKSEGWGWGIIFTCVNFVYAAFV